MYFDYFGIFPIHVWVTKYHAGNRLPQWSKIGGGGGVGPAIGLNPGQVSYGLSYGLSPILFVCVFSQNIWFRQLLCGIQQCSYFSRCVWGYLVSLLSTQGSCLAFCRQGLVWADGSVMKTTCFPKQQVSGHSCIKHQVRNPLKST